MRAPKGPHEELICRVFAEVLGLDEVGALDGFFELGGDSLSAVRILVRLREAGLPEVSVATFFAAPTPAGLARAVAAVAAGGEGSAAARTATRAARRLPTDVREPIAIVGMAGRFPGAANVEAFWKNLCGGVESIRTFAKSELDPSIPAEPARRPRLRGGAWRLDGVELFDAAFFGISPLEAQVMDPQHRHFLEVSWQALEHAGYVPERGQGRSVSSAACTTPRTTSGTCAHRPDVTSRLGDLAGDARQREGLRHQPRRAPPRSRRTGGQRPHRVLDVAGRYRNGDGQPAQRWLRRRARRRRRHHLSATAAATSTRKARWRRPTATPARSTRKAAGTVFSDGVAVVVLRRLSDAIADGDTVYAVLLGAAVNNDGERARELHRAEPDGPGDGDRRGPRRRRHRRAHALLRRGPRHRDAARRSHRDRGPDSRLPASHADRGFCAIGSLKSNVGHMVIAAGAASLIKTALALLAPHAAALDRLRDAQSADRLRAQSVPGPGQARPLACARGRRTTPRRGQLVRLRRHQRPRRPGGAARRAPCGTVGKAVPARDLVGA